MYRQWYELQRKYFLKQYDLIEYANGVWGQNSWHIILNQEAQKKPYNFNNDRGIQHVEIEKELDQVNLSLAQLNLTDFKPQKDFWESIEKEIKIKGILVPMSAMVNLGITSLSTSLNYIHIFCQFYPFHNVIQQSHDAIRDNDSTSSVRSYKFLWSTIESCATFLSCLQDEKSKSIVHHQLSTIWNHTSVNELLPSEQLIQVLMKLLIDISKTQYSYVTESLDSYHRSVRDFFETHEASLGSTLSKRVNSILWEKEDIDNIEIIKASFYQVCDHDLAYINIQQLINLPDDHDSVIMLPQTIKDAIYRLRSDSLVDKFRIIVQKKSIIKRIKSIAFKQDQYQFPDFNIDQNPWHSEHKYYWYQLTDQTIAEINEIFNQKASGLKTTKDVQRLQTSGIQQTLNKLTKPGLKWALVNAKLMPLWNTCQHEELDKAIELFNKDRALEIREAERLRQTIKTLRSFNTEDELDEFLKSIPSFEVDIYTEKLELEIITIRQNIQNRRHFKIRKMEEFGITAELVPSYKNRETYLEELLKIEEEVEPYILYVKKIFNSALPESKENFFDPYRHSIDGIEFDPETIQDVDKWFKGEVMKTINIKSQIVKAVQINCFAMDSSGSMAHEQMRNLFKIIYLVIIGLSGKESYDSFHFFGTHFVPTAEFNHSFSSKNLLYKILRKISRIDSKGKVSYSGVGGTFLSGAITKCHERINEFSKPFEEKKVNHLKSLFVITDGEPSYGIIEPTEIAQLLNEKRKDGNVSIKGIYIGPKSDIPFMSTIFGEDEYVETENFEAAMIGLIDIMAKTFKEQRKKLKQSKKQEKYS